MRKYIIKGAYRSEYSNMKTEFNSRKDAINALIDYIYNYNKNLNDDDNLITPFDFIIKEIDVKDVNETITDFERAREALGIKPNADFYVVKRKHSEKVAHLQEAARLVTDINPKHIKALIALNELFTIAEAWNKEDGFVPDFSDLGQYKWFPWLRYDKDAARFVCVTTNRTPATASASFGSRLCFKTSERAARFGKQFADLYNKVFL